MFTLVREVKSWRKLAKELVYAYDQDDGQYSYMLYVPNSTDLDTLQRRHGFDEECLKFVIEKFLQGKGGRYKQPSWRAVIWSLYKANEIQLASHIKSYGELLQGVCAVYVYYKLVGRLRTQLDFQVGPWTCIKSTDLNS